MNCDQDDLQPHQPVLIKSLIDNISPVSGTWVDCTFGAGGYSTALLEAGAKMVIGVDRDPQVIAGATKLQRVYGAKLELNEAKFSSLQKVVSGYDKKKIAGVVFDIGVSSMQIDQPERGFSFQKDGPLDMRMSQKGISASDIVNAASEEELADIIYYYGEERFARVIARAIINERMLRPILTTAHLSRLVKSVVKKPRSSNKKELNPATLTFQALRIAVNNELEELHLGLLAAEKILGDGAVLAVVSFHSLEDRLVKHFIKSRSRLSSGKSRHLPEQVMDSPTFRELFSKVVKPTNDEIIQNPRARSAKLRIAIKLASNTRTNEVTQVKFPKVKLEMKLD
jgi:16S rRNA (cytosine1402-N4)-methyltransferase